MFNMEAAVSPLSESPEFAGLFASLSNPVIGVLVGAGVTAIIQSSSASIGILQALSSTGIITWSSAIPIILGQNIGTCITPILASIGASKNAKRTAAVHLSFNIIGTCVFLIVIYTIQSISPFSFWDLPIDKGGIANFHTTFNVCVTLMFLPFVGLLEKLVIHLIPDQQTADEVDDPAIALDDRLLASPGLAIQHCRDAVLQMGKLARKNFSASVRQLEQYNHKEAEKIREREDTIDRLEDRLGNYMLKIPQDNLSEQSSATISALLHILSEFERIGDYSINLVEFAENMESTGAEFSPQAQFELTTIGEAVGEAIDMALGCFEKQDLALAETIEPLEEVVDQMQETLKDRHINRLRNGQCTVDAAFPFVESLSCLERISDHCSNIGVYMISYVRGSDEVDHHTYIMPAAFRSGGTLQRTVPPLYREILRSDPFCQGITPSDPIESRTHPRVCPAFCCAEDWAAGAAVWVRLCLMRGRLRTGAGEKGTSMRRGWRRVACQRAGSGSTGLSRHSAPAKGIKTAPAVWGQTLFGFRLCLGIYRGLGVLIDGAPRSWGQNSRRKADPLPEPRAVPERELIHSPQR